METGEGSRIEKKRKEKQEKKEIKRKDYTFRRQFNVKPRIILGCPDEGHLIFWVGCIQ